MTYAKVTYVKKIRGPLNAWTFVNTYGYVDIIMLIKKFRSVHKSNLTH